VALPADLVERAVDDALRLARERGIRGAATTPFLLAAVERATDGRSLHTNLALLEANASLAAGIAACLTSERRA
jgi:pseudouridylate synthase